MLPSLCAGSGAAIAIGVLEAEYDKGLDCEAGVELAKKSIKAAIARDAMSGDGLDIMVIRADGSEVRTESFRS